MSNAATAAVADDATVAHDLANADNSMAFAPHQNVDATFVQGHEAPAAEPKALGLDATAWVSLAMLVVFALMLVKKVPATIGRMLDKKIAGIRQQLDEASKLRADAEALKAEYAAKTAGAAAEADAIRAAAQHEAEALLVKARADAEALVERRAKMAEDKIGAAERAAVAEVRAKAASAAAAAAAALIGEVHDKTADKALIDSAISRLN